MSFQTIRSAQQTIWPAVRDNLVRIRAAREAVNEKSSAAAKSRARVPWNHVVANETVWAIAKADLLATPEQAKLVEVARRWLALNGPEMVAFPEDFDDIDFELRDAVQNYIASYKISDDEVLQLPQPSATVTASPTN